MVRICPCIIGCCIDLPIEIDVPVEDLSAPRNGRGPRPSFGRQIDSETASMHSVQSNLTKASMRESNRQVTSSGASVRSVARSYVSTVSRATASTAAPSFRSRQTVTERESRPDSKLAPALGSSASASSRSSAMDVDEDEDATQRPRKVADYGIEVGFDLLEENEKKVCALLNDLVKQ